MTTNYTSHYLRTRLLTSAEDILAHKFALSLKCKPHEVMTNVTIVMVHSYKDYSCHPKEEHIYA
jgi:hypothetical protein